MDSNVKLASPSDRAWGSYLTNETVIKDMSPFPEGRTAEPLMVSNITQQERHSRVQLENSLNQIKPMPSYRSRLAPLPEVEIDAKNTLVFQRPNKMVAPYTKFDISPYKKPFSIDRMQSITARDAIFDPTQTNAPVTDPLYRDPGQPDLCKRDTKTHDIVEKTIKDMCGRNLIKVQGSHGLRNGGLYCQSTHGRSQSDISPDRMGTFKSRRNSDFANIAQQMV